MWCINLFQHILTFCLFFLFCFVKDTIHTVFTWDSTTTFAGRKQFDHRIGINWVSGRLLSGASIKLDIIWRLIVTLDNSCHNSPWETTWHIATTDSLMTLMAAMFNKATAAHIRALCHLSSCIHKLCSVSRDVALRGVYFMFPCAHRPSNPCLSNLLCRSYIINSHYIVGQGYFTFNYNLLMDYLLTDPMRHTIHPFDKSSASIRSPLQSQE